MIRGLGLSGHGILECIVDGGGWWGLVEAWGGGLSGVARVVFGLVFGVVWEVVRGWRVVKGVLGGCSLVGVFGSWGFLGWSG